MSRPVSCTRNSPRWWLLLLLWLSGCGSVVSLAEPRPFGGLRNDWIALSRVSHPVAWLAVLDMPLSLGVDVALLPLTTGLWLAREEPEPVTEE